MIMAMAVLADIGYVSLSSFYGKNNNNNDDDDTSWVQIPFRPDFF